MPEEYRRKIQTPLRVSAPTSSTRRRCEQDRGTTPDPDRANGPPGQGRSVALTATGRRTPRDPARPRKTAIVKCKTTIRCPGSVASGGRHKIVTSRSRGNSSSSSRTRTRTTIRGHSAIGQGPGTVGWKIPAVSCERTAVPKKKEKTQCRRHCLRFETKKH